MVILAGKGNLESPFVVDLSSDRLEATVHPWLVEIEVLEPGKSRLRVEGERVTVQVSDGTRQAQELPPEFEKQFHEMSERALGANPAEQRKAMDIKVLRHNNPVFGPKTTTVEYRPHGTIKLFDRSEEDVDVDGLPLATRLYDAAGRETVRLKVARHRKISGIPVMEAMESVSQSPVGEIMGRTTCSGTDVDAEP